VCPGVKVSDSVHGRLSGGLVFLVKQKFVHLVQQVPVETDNIIVLKLKAELLGTNTDCLLVGVYLPPENAKYYEDTEIYNGVSILEDCFLEMFAECGDLPLILCGDLNSRTGTSNFVYTDNLHSIYEFVDKDDATSSNNAFLRTSKDSVVNSFGRYLLSVCEEFVLVILNGLKNFNSSHDFTYISDQGCSVIDYFIVSHSLFSQFEFLKLIPLVETKHVAIVLSLAVNNSSLLQEDVDTQNVTSCTKFKWDDQKTQLFMENVHSGCFHDYLKEAMNLVDVDIDLSLLKFNEGLIKAGDCMMKTIFFGNEKRRVWFDLECRQSRKVLRRHLHTFTRHNTDTDRQSYIQKRREYKELLRQKKKSHKENIILTIQNSLNNPRQFWDTVRSVRPRPNAHNTISVDQWYQHFHSVFNEVACDESSDEDFDAFYDNANVQPACDDLNQPITVNEIQFAIKSLKCQKAPGPDNLIGEFYKHSSTVILPYFLKLFNYIFDNGLFPEDWTVSILHPLHKKGDLNDPDNYRGISLLNICSKLYSFVLNRRISQWVELNNVVGEEQAGFRENRCTNDHIFTLLACVQKQLLRHRKLYVAFIDFKKAFDSVCRDKLWKILFLNGINGKMLNALKSMYDIVKARVRVGSDFSDAFFCPRGLKQGEVCSPVLFSLLINELTKEINANGKHGIQLSPDIIQILIMLFADDVALLSDSITGLQTQLNILYNVAKRLDLIVNLDKSNIVVFRNGGFLSHNEKWIFGSNQLTVVNMYKYLGIIFTTRLSFQQTFLDLSERASKGVSALIRMLWSIGEHSPKFFFKLFDSQIQPILTYGSEVWGLTVNQTVIERVHLSAMKRFLCVTQKTPKHVIYGELGRYPLFVNTYAKCIKFWLRLVCMDDSRVTKKAYNLLLLLQGQNYVTWACKVRNVLYTYGFGIVWEAQSVGSIKLFIAQFKQRLQDNYSQDWHSALQSHSFYEIYSTYAFSLSLRPYFQCITSVNVRKIFTRFRIGMLPLRNHFLKFDNMRRNQNTFCPFCENAFETEFHFLLICPKYDALRQQYIPRKYFRHPTLFNMSLLLSSNNENLVVRVGVFVYKSYYVRKRCLDVCG